MLKMFMMSAGIFLAATFDRSQNKFSLLSDSGLLVYRKKIYINIMFKLTG